ncbi:3-carboxy-cis,cis-muconate cycloisomerase [Terrarubrum flagellatum]|uniref:3-carboxy-cis,cis-muconate cycloisomerase n=1 Tax=Terrirubrum flagellatum TaxID=2895980 RepID=UPI00314534A9
MRSYFPLPLLSELLGDAEIEAWFDPRAEIAAMLAFEKALAEAEASEGVITADDARAIVGAIAHFEPDLDALAKGVAHDGVIVPELVRQLRAAIPEPHRRHAHFGSTSQDVIDTALALRMKDVLRKIEALIHQLLLQLDSLSARDGAHRLMGHTRMQRAREITAAQKIESWRAPLKRHLARLHEWRPRLLTLQLGGAVGNRAELGDHAQKVADLMAAALDLNHAAEAWHTQRDAIVECGQWLSLVCGHLGKIGVDITLMAQNELAEVQLAAGGGSSAMPEKNNPVKAEILVTLARYAATLAGGLHHSLVHENERSGAAWTLEWMLLPPLCITTGAALRNASALLADIASIGVARG